MDRRKRTTSENITYLLANEIFVFGSNESGMHYGGAAKAAMKWGAVLGEAEGIQGRTYAIPTVKEKIAGKLPVEKIRKYVDNFISFAKKHPNMVFLTTEIGCGLAGWRVEDIAPLFKDAMNVDNIFLPARFWEFLDNS